MLSELFSTYGLPYLRITAVAGGVVGYSIAAMRTTKRARAAAAEVCRKNHEDDTDMEFHGNDCSRCPSTPNLWLDAPAYAIAGVFAGPFILPGVIFYGPAWIYNQVENNTHAREKADKEHRAWQQKQRDEHEAAMLRLNRFNSSAKSTPEDAPETRPDHL